MEELKVEGQLKMKDLADKLNEVIGTLSSAGSPVQEHIGAPIVTKEEFNSLKECVERIATLTGNGNMLMQFGLERWTPGKKDMSKYDS